MITKGMKVRITDAASVDHIGTISAIEEVETDDFCWATVVDIELPVLEKGKLVSVLVTWPVAASHIVEG